ncbi:uncharacterized protein VTP21DRAFT_3006 [Calcarisporiella thermophila]|uniref:uncharacterized protein n=1 Tax=Calcarisporiella thermophila TaxID=911321 RepID=UPI003743664B
MERARDEDAKGSTCENPSGFEFISVSHVLMLQVHKTTAISLYQNSRLSTVKMQEEKHLLSYPSDATPHMTLTRRGPIFLLRMRNNENRLSDAFIKGIHQCLQVVEDAYENEGPCEMALVTTGEGKFYSNGLDMSVFEVPNFVQTVFYKLLRRMLIFPIPTIAVLNGHTFAGGCLLALAHDYRVMRKDRGFMCMNELDISLPLIPGLAAVVRVKTTPQVYRDVCLQAKRYPADVALQSGLVDEVGTEDELLNKGLALAQKWAPKAKSPVYGSIKQNMYWEALLHLEPEEQAKL